MRARWVQICEYLSPAVNTFDCDLANFKIKYRICRQTIKFRKQVALCLRPKGLVVEIRALPKIPTRFPSPRRIKRITLGSRRVLELALVRDIARIVSFVNLETKQSAALPPPPPSRKLGNERYARHGNFRLCCNALRISPHATCVRTKL